MLPLKPCALLLALLMVVDCIAASSIAEYGDTLIDALERRDTRLFESLIHPRTIQLSREQDPDAHIKKIELILEQKPPSVYKTHKVVVTDINKDGDYNALENSIPLFGSRRAIFPVQIEKRLTIFVKDGDLNQDGEWTTPLTTQALSRFEGNWYMVWPQEIK